MIARVATFALNNAMIASALQNQSKVSERQIQTASGLVSTDFGGLGATSKKVIDLQVSISQSKNYEDAATSASNRIEVMYSSVGSMVDLLSSFKSELTSALSVNGSDSSALKDSAEELMNEMASLLNTQYGGRYLFGGEATTTAPVDLSFYSNTTSSSVADTSYYKGGSDIASVRVSNSQSVSYGVTADNAAFEKAMRAFSMIANASSPVDTGTISDAVDLATEALDAVTSVQSKLSLASKQIDRAVANQQDFQDYAGTLVSSLTDVDVAAVTAELSAYQSQLEASYSALAKIASLRLSDYLR